MRSLPHCVRYLLLPFALLTFGANLNAEGSTSVVAVRFWSLSDVTRIVIETTGDFKFKSDRIQDPDRVFFDIIGARMRLGRKGQETIRVGDKLIRKIRVAESQPGTTRVVFDLDGNVEYTASQLSNPDRLIVELRPSGKRPGDIPVTMSVTGSHVIETAPEAIASPASQIPRPAPPQPNVVSDNPPAVAAPAVSTAAVKDPVRAVEQIHAKRPMAVTAKTIPAIVPAMPAPQPAAPVLTASVQDYGEKTRRTTTTPLPAPDSGRPARLPKHGEQSLTRVLGLKVGRIVIDAGHGGHDEGTHGPSGFTEKELVLDVARRLGALIEARMGSEVIYTRQDDTFIPLEERTRIANEAKADLFLSVHANSSPEKASSGVETYYLNFTTSQHALEVAARENATSQKTVYELKDLLQKIALRDKVDESKEFASRVQTSMASFSVRQNSRARDRGVKKAPFVVLIGANMPSVLAEIGFITNPRDESQMKKPEYRQKIAEALYKGVHQYAMTLSHFQVASR